MHGHLVLAFMHAANHLQLGHATVPKLSLDQAVWDHADDLSTCGQGTVSHRAHQAGAAAAVNQSPAAFANLASDFTSDGFKLWGLAHP